MIINNPEFKKNLKLEFSSFRFVIPLLILFLVMWIGWGGEDGNAWQTQYDLEQQKAKSLFFWLCGFGFFFTVVWGTYLTANSLLEEIRLKTWDFVRLSSLAPFKILTGKILGTPSVIWLVTFVFVMPCLAFAGLTMIPQAGVIRPENISVTMLLLSIFFWVVLSYSLVFIVILSSPDVQKRSGIFGVTAVVAGLGVTLGAKIIDHFEDFHRLYKYGYEVNDKIVPLPVNGIIVSADESYMRTPPTTDWYGMSLYELDALVLVLGFAAIWAFIGAWRSLRQSLLYTDAPWVWLCFIISTVALLNGFTSKGEFGLNGFLYWPALVGFVTMYVACMDEVSTAETYHAFFRKITSGERAKDLWRKVPLWMISGTLFLATIILNVLFVKEEYLEEVLVFTFSITIFALRDMMIFHAIAWKPNVRRPLLGIIIYMAMAYLLFPNVAKTFGDDAKAYFLPVLDIDKAGLHLSSAYWSFAGLQLAAALFLFIRAWRKTFGQPKQLQTAP